MEIKKFNELTKDELNYLIDIHYNHWVKFNPNMKKEDTIYKFTKLYTTSDMPFGIALIDNNIIVGFCVLKMENLKKYPDIHPWLSDVMIIKEYRNKGYGRKLVSYAEQVLKDLGYKSIYLWTDQAPDFYKKLGFSYKQKVEKNEGGFGELFFKEL